MHFDLSVIWFAIIVFATLMYIVMDGFDLGIGILMPFIKNEKHKDVMVNTVAPVWDGNETWIVLGGAALIIISAWTPFAFPFVAERWFSIPNLYYLLPVPVITTLACLKITNSLKKRRERSPFIMALIIVILGFAGLGISIWPNIVPPSISIWDAASPEISQSFMLFGAVLILPVILAYTFWSYYVFSGKVKEGESYH